MRGSEGLKSGRGLTQEVERVGWRGDRRFRQGRGVEDEEEIEDKRVRSKE